MFLYFQNKSQTGQFPSNKSIISRRCTKYVRNWLTQIRPRFWYRSMTICYAYHPLNESNFWLKLVYKYTSLPMDRVDVCLSLSIWTRFSRCFCQPQAQKTRVWISTRQELPPFHCLVPEFLRYNPAINHTNESLVLYSTDLKKVHILD